MPANLRTKTATCKEEPPSITFCYEHGCKRQIKATTPLSYAVHLYRRTDGFRDGIRSFVFRTCEDYQPGRYTLPAEEPAKSILPKSLLHFLVGSIVNTSDYDRIREGDTLPA
jgi:hypothetical protein